MTVPNGDPKSEVIIVPTPSTTMLSITGYASPVWMWVRVGERWVGVGRVVTLSKRLIGMRSST